MKNFNSIDIMKLILAVLVVVIHNNPFGDTSRYMYIILYLSVPLFFISSSFLFFYKMAEEGDACLSKFLSRNAKLYLAWFICLFPATLVIRGYFAQGIFSGVVQICVNALFGSTFRSSWFLVANMIGIIIVYYTRNNTFIGEILGVLSYIVCCLATAYNPILGEGSVVRGLIHMYPTTIYQSFPFAIIWSCVGYWLAKTYTYWSLWKLKKLFLLFLPCAILYSIEGLCCKLEPGYGVFMPLVCTLLFMIICRWEVQFKWSRLFRNISTVTYCLGATLGQIICMFVTGITGNSVVWPYSMIVFCVIIIVCFFATYLILYLKERKGFRWCKYLI